MIINHVDSAGREFLFELKEDRWSVRVTGEQFTIYGTMPAVRDWQGKVIVSGKALYRMGAGANLYTMTVQDETELEAEHLSFLEGTGRHPSRIKKSKARIDWLMRLQQLDFEFMRAEWSQGSEVPK